MYDSLLKIYHIDESRHEQEYQKRYNAPSSVHFGIVIRQFNHNKEYPAFFNYTHELALSLERIYSEFFDFLRILPYLTPGMQHQYVLSSIVDEVHSTSDIEGIHSTHRELMELLDGLQGRTHFSSIMKKYDLLSSGDYPKFETCEDVRNFYDEFNHMDAIAENAKNLLDGRIFRKDAVDVKSSSGKTLHRGVEPEERIIEYMTEALSMLNSSENPALIRIAVFHYLFVYIHPFYDGNGRTARFISSSLIAQHLHTLVGLRLSYTIKKHQGKYYRMLKETDAEKNCGDLTPFIHGFLGFIHETLQEINRRQRHKIKQLDRMKTKLLSVLPTEEDIQRIAYRILQSSVFYGQGALMEELMTEIDRTRNTVKSKLSRIPIRTITRNRTKYYKLDLWELKRKLKGI